MAQLDACRTSDQEMGVRSPSSRQLPVLEIDHEIYSVVILSLPLIQEGHLSVSGEKMCTRLVNRLENKSAL